MNKTFRILCSLTVAAALWGCGKEPLPEGNNGGNAPAPEVEKPVVYADNEVVATFSGGLTKTMNDAEGVYTWAENDSIAVYTTRGHFVTYYLTEGAGQTTAKFKAQLREGEKPLAFASYPVGTAHYQMDKLSVVMPSSYKVNDGLNQVPMMAQFEEGAQQISFAPLAGVLLITMEGIPAEATTFQFRTEDNTRVTGKFDFDQNGITAAQGEGKDVVTVDFTPGQSAMSYAIPLPAGAYSKFTVTFLDAQGAVLASRTSGNVQIQNSVVKTLAPIKSVISDLYVTPDAKGYGTSWEDPMPLSDALSLIADGITVYLGKGTYDVQAANGGNTYVPASLPADAKVSFIGQTGTVWTTGHETSNSRILLCENVQLGNMTFNNIRFEKEGANTAGVLSFRKEISGNVLFQNCSFTVTAESNNPGAAVVINPSSAGLTVKFDQCTFSDCKSLSHRAGAVSIQGKNAVVDFSGCTFKGNTAKASGGAVSSYDGTVSFDQCHFESNVSNATGGAIYNNSCRLTITGTTFKSNTSVTAAGALSNEVGTVIIDGCKFISNSSPNHGAAVCTYGEKISGNDTIEGRAELYVYNTLFEGNGSDTATDQGGAIKAHGNGDMVIVNSTIKGNGAKNGIIRFRSQVAESVKAWVISCTFSGNNKYSLYNQSSNLTVCNSVMDDLNSYRSNNKAGKLVVQKSVFNNAGHSMVQNLDFTGEVKDNTGLSGATKLENTVVGSFAGGVFSVSGVALTGGMSSDELSALGSDIKAAMPLFDESKLLVDQNGNSRVGKTVMGASVR